MRLPPEQREFTERMALEIFSDMTMNGHTFVQALAAIYLSGLEHGAKTAAYTTTKEEVKNDGN